jgi:hypothetical protein
MDSNPHLKPWSKPQPNTVAGKGAIENPGQTDNIVWQTRPAAPNAYEISLADGLEAVFSQGAQALDEVVAKLNEIGVRSPEGTAWTVDRFEAEMARLGY